MRTGTMRNRFLSACCVAASFAACAAARAGEAPKYSLTLVDSGQSSSHVIPRAINDRGEIAGTLSLDAGGRRPVLWTPTAGTTLLRGFTGGPAGEGLGVGINNAGQVVGTLSNRAAFWPSASGNATAVAPEPSDAHAVNDAGVVVGILRSSTEPTQAFRRLADGTLQYVSDPGLTDPTAGPINASGYVTGQSREGPFLWAPDGSITPLPGLVEGTSFGGAYGMNDQNWVVGTQHATSEESVALLWLPGEGPIDLGGLPGETSSFAEGINNDGVAAGTSIVGGLPRAFVWTQEEGALSLTDLLDATGRGWVLNNAFDINERGQIIGLGIYQGRQQGFLLTPVPEPAAGLSIAAVAGAVALRRRRGGAFHGRPRRLTSRPWATA